MTTTEQKSTSSATLWLKQHKMLCIIAAVLIVLLATAIILIALNSFTLFKANKFEKLELGMTQEQVKKLMGKADRTHTVSPTDDAAPYGYSGVTLWYYENVKDSEKNAEELANEGKTFHRIRAVFDENGKLIEAYYNTAYLAQAGNDYGKDNEKELSQITYAEKPTAGCEAQQFTDTSESETGFSSNTTQTRYVWTLSKDAATVSITYADGSAFIGECTLTEINSNKSKLICAVKIPWDNTTLEFKQAE